jgi:FixJ family two-component response regulator
MVMIAGSTKYIGVYGGTANLLAWLEATLPGVSICGCSQPQECLQRLLHEPCDLLVVDLKGRLDKGLDVIAKVAETIPWLASIAIVETDNVSAAIRAMKAGAADCLERPVGAVRWKEVVETHREHIMRKLNASSILNLVRRVCVRGLPWPYNCDTPVGRERS